MNQPTAAKPAAPACATSASRRLPARIGEAGEAGNWMSRRFPGRGEDGAEHQVVAAVGGGDLRRRMHRAADDEPGRDDRAHPGAGRRVAAQVHARRATRDGDVGPVVHQHTCAAAGQRRHDRPDQIEQRAVGQVPLADLHHGRASRDRRHRLRDQRGGREAEANPIGDEMADHDWVCRRDRDTMTAPSSITPATAVMTPTPLTAPRT